MATDFNTNAISSKGGFKPAAPNTPLDIRSRVETEDDILKIPRPFIGMVVYVEDTGKRYEILTLKDLKAGLSTVKNGAVDTYRELVISYNDLSDKPEIPSIEGLASEEFVNQQIAAIPEVDLDPYAVKEEVNSALDEKVDKVEGKSLVDDAEISRLAGVDNYNDAELRDILADKADKSELFSKDYNELENLPEIPSIEGLASEEFVNEGLAAKVDKVEGKSLVDDTEIARLADVDNYDDDELRGLINEKADKSELFSKDYNELNNKPEIPSIEGLASEEFVNQQISAIPPTDLSKHATKEEVNSALDNKVDKVEGKSLVDDAEIERLAGVDNYELPVATNENLGGVKAGSNIQITQDGVINGANYQFQVNMIENGFEPSVEIVGDFPNLTVVFNLPKCYPIVPEDTNAKMWYGYIPYDETGMDGFSEADHINENMTHDIIQFGLNDLTLTEATPEAIGAIDLTGVPDLAFVCTILPLDSKLVGLIDDGSGKPCKFTEFDTVSGLSVDEVELVNKIDGVSYKLSGMYVTDGGGMLTIYINEK